MVEQPATPSLINEEGKNRSLDYFAIKFPIYNFVDHHSNDGAKIQNYRWAAATEDGKPPKAVISMFHGYGSYVDKFAYIAKPFVEKGYDVIGMDYKGFGHSEGIRGFIGDRHQFYEDGYQFIRKARKFYGELFPGGENLPFFTMGYSQGGALSHGIARYLHKNGDPQLAGQLHVVPNFAIQQDHWTEEYKLELAEKSKDPSLTCAFPAKPLKDWSFLLSYIQDDLQFKGPHFAATIDIVKQVSDEDREYFKEITHPVHVTRADGDNILNNSEINRYFDTIKTHRNTLGTEDNSV